MAARRCVSCRYDHAPSLAAVRCPWCSKRTVPVPSAIPTDDGLARYSVQVVALREELARMTARAEQRGLTVADLIDVRDPAVPPADMW